MCPMRIATVGGGCGLRDYDQGAVKPLAQRPPEEQLLDPFEGCSIDEKVERLEARIKRLIEDEDDNNLVVYLKALKLALGTRVENPPSQSFCMRLKEMYRKLHLFRHGSHLMFNPELAFARTQQWIFEQVVQSLDCDYSNDSCRDTFKFFVSIMESEAMVAGVEPKCAQNMVEILKRVKSQVLSLMRDRIAGEFKKVEDFDPFVLENMPEDMANLFVMAQAKVGGHSFAKQHTFYRRVLEPFGIEHRLPESIEILGSFVQDLFRLDVVLRHIRDDLRGYGPDTLRILPEYVPGKHLIKIGFELTFKSDKSADARQKLAEIDGIVRNRVRTMRSPNVMVWLRVQEEGNKTPLLDVTLNG